jgi:hypothetical protein
MESLLLAALHPVYTKEKQKKHSVRNEPAVMHVWFSTEKRNPKKKIRSGD